MGGTSETFSSKKVRKAIVEHFLKSLTGLEVLGVSYICSNWRGRSLMTASVRIGHLTDKKNKANGYFAKVSKVKFPTASS